MLPLQEMHDVLPKAGLIYEVGCGTGVISRYIAGIPKRQVVGIDHELDKIDRTRLMPNLSFKSADALKFSYRVCTGVVLSDFLHHISFTSQGVLLKELTKKIKINGVLVIKEIARDDGIFMWLSRLWDFLLYPEDRINYRSRREWVSLLNDLGFIVKVQRTARWFPGSTHLFVCRKN